MRQRILVVAALAATCLFVSCKKTDKTELDTQTQQFNDDANNYKLESDQIDDDINNSINDNGFWDRRAGVASSPLCGVTIDTSQLAQKILTYNFDGVTPCFGPSRTRSGQVKVQLTSGNSWQDAGAQLTISYLNFKITRLSDNKSITFNGVKTLTNVSGHNWLTFLLGTSTFTHQSRAFNVAVTFDNGQSAVWNHAYSTQWSYSPTGLHSPLITFTGVGDTTYTGYSNTASWGVNRYGQNFVTYYQAPYVSNTYCGLWRPLSGSLTHHVNTNDFTLTLGVDQSGNASTLDCAYGYKVTWTVNGNTNTMVQSY